MTDRTIQLTVSAELGAEADAIAAAMGVSVETIAWRGLAGYLAGVREAQRLEEGSLRRLPSSSEGGVPLEGDEGWLSTLD